MEENTIFHNPAGSDPSPQNLSQKNQVNPPESNDAASFFSGIDFSIFIKIVLGILFIALLIFIISNFILPKFSTKKKVENVSLTYWGLWEEKNVMSSVITQFEKENPNIKINYVKQDIKEYKDRLIARTQNGTGPDIFRIHSTWLPMVSSILVPFPNDVVTKDEFRRVFYPTAQNDLTRNGAIYAIPLQIDTLALFVNTELFKAAGLQVPSNWDEFLKAAVILTVRDEDGKIKTSGAAMGTFNNVTHAPDIISLLLIQNGVDLKNFSGNQNVSDALDYYTHFARVDRVWDQTLDPSILAFSKGNLAMYFGYSWDVFLIKTLNPTLPFKIYPVPHILGRDLTIASYWAEGVSGKNKHQKEAMLFLKYLTKAPTQQKLFAEEAKTRLFGEPYARVDLAESLKSNEFLYPFVSQGGQAVSSFFASDTFDNGLNAQMNAYLQNAVNSVLSNTSPQTAAEVLAKGVDQVLKQYGQR